MADDLYSDGDYEGSAPSDRKASNEESKEQTALLPISLCPGMEPGDIIRLRIEGVHEEDYMVSYVEADEEEDEEAEEMPMEQPMSRMNDMDEMMT